MSFNSPQLPIPTSIASTKASFIFEEISSSDAVMDQKKLYLRKSGETSWNVYVLDPEVVNLSVDILAANNLYEVKVGYIGVPNGGVDEETHESQIYTFRTRHSERFSLRPPIPTPLSGGAFTAALQYELDENINYVNTVDDEQAIERLFKEGVGRIVNPNLSDGGALLTKDSIGTNLYITDGSFQSGPGVESDDDFYFYGARVFQILTTTGALALVDDNELDLSTDGTYYGYMAGYWDEGEVKFSVIWKTSLDVVRENGRWLIGKVVVSEGLVSEVDTSITDEITSLALLRKRLKDLEDGNTVSNPGNGNSGDNTGPSIRLNFSNDTTISSPLAVDTWLDVVVNKEFAIDNALSVTAFSLSSLVKVAGSAASTTSARIVIDQGTPAESIYNIGGASYGANGFINPFSGNSVIYVAGLSKSSHTVKVQVKSSSLATVTAAIDDLRIQVVEFGSVFGPNGLVEAKNIAFDSTKTPVLSILGAVNNLRTEILLLLDEKLASLDPTEKVQLDYLIRQVADAIASLGEVYPEGLLAIDGSNILPDKYGMLGNQIDLDGDGTKETQSPIFDRRGSMIYDPSIRKWKVGNAT